MAPGRGATPTLAAMAREVFERTLRYPRSRGETKEV
jgi:hypothetical protein